MSKRIIALNITLLICGALFGQKKELAAKAFQEIDSIITHPFQLLGKTDSEIIAAGRPTSIIGGDKWEAKSIEAPGKNSMYASKAIGIDTGCGGILLMISKRTNLVYYITYVPHKKAKLKGMDIWDHLNGVYEFDPRANAIIELKDSGLIGMSVLEGGIMIIAFEKDRKGVRFKN